MSVLVICPTRDRPELAHNLIRSFLATSENGRLLMMVDDDQTELYPMPEIRNVEWVVGPRRPLVQMMNDEVLNRIDDHTIYGMVADDCVFLTPGWDQRMIDSMGDEVGARCLKHNFGKVFDMPFVSREWVKRLGWFAKPVFDYWGWPTYNIMLGEMTKIDWADGELRHDELGPQYWDTIDKEARVFYEQCSFFMYEDVRKLRGV